MEVVYPDVWSEGQLFAFSGFDGETDWANSFVGATLGDRRGYSFYPPAGFMDRGQPPQVWVGLAGPGGRPEPLPGAGADVSDAYVLSDLAEFTASGDDWALAVTALWHDKDTCLFVFRAERLPEEGLEASLVVEGPDPWDGSVALGGSRMRVIGAVAASHDAGYRFSRELSAGAPVVLALRREGPGASPAPGKLARIDWRAVRAARLDFYRRIAPPAVKDAAIAKAYYKCASVMRVNAESPQGPITVPWTTPDRWPHKHMWLWDSAFHAMGYKYLDPQWGRDCILSVLSIQAPDGFVAHMAQPDGDTSDITQPPVLAWAALDVHRYDPDRGFLKSAYPGLCRYIEWDLASLDPDGDGLAAYGGGDSGMDNSPRFDRDVPHMGSLCLNCFLVSDMRALAEIAHELGLADDAVGWQARADALAALINKDLWDEESGFYYDKGKSGRLIKIKTEAGFTPLFAGVAPAERAARLVQHLTNPNEFWTPMPLPSVSADEATYSDDMWRGPVWVNYSFFLVQGLLRYGFDDVAAELTRLTVDEVVRLYEAEGVIYEFYDPGKRVSPWDLHRKTHTNRTIRDYGFTTTLFVEMVNRYDPRRGE